MGESFYLITGTILLLITFYDFFFTTLSASGAAFITKNFSIFLHKFMLAAAKVFGRKLFNFSGVWINLPMLFLWLLLFWTGLFLVFSYYPEGVVSSSGKTASAVERFYFSGYVLSTLGMGNFKPVTPFFEILTSAFSLLGFIVITTSMTYFISVSSAIIQKRSIGLMFKQVGDTPQEVLNKLMNMTTTSRVLQFNSLQQMINNHSNNHHSYPVIHFYNTPEKSSSFSINLAVMDEAISIILQSDHLKEIHSEVDPLRKSITNFLEHVQGKYDIKTQSSPQFRWKDLELPENVLKKEANQSHLIDRRKIIGGLLKGENWSWKEVYPESVIEGKK